MSSTRLPLARIQVLAGEALGERFAILSYDHDNFRMKIFHWPTTRESRVKPSDFGEYRKTHHFKNPSCFCPLLDDSGPGAYVESAMYRPSRGPWAGLWVAACSRDRCPYLVILEAIYPVLGLPIKVYGERDGELPNLIVHISDQEHVAMAPRPLKRTYAQLDVTNPLLSYQVPPVRKKVRFAEPARAGRRRSVSMLLGALDSRVRSGITLNEFRRIFVICECNTVTTRRAFMKHDCSREVIDLTEEGGEIPTDIDD